MPPKKGRRQNDLKNFAGGPKMPILGVKMIGDL